MQHDIKTSGFDRVMKGLVGVPKSELDAAERRYEVAKKRRQTIKRKKK